MTDGEAQERLPGTEATDPIGVEAETYVNRKKVRDQANDNLKAQAVKVIGMLKDAGRKSIKAGGMTLTWNHKNAEDKLSVKVTKQSQKDAK